MKYTDVFSIDAASAVCYSGYRDGQVPGVSFPSYNEVKEDLLIVKKHWSYIRLYSCDAHSKTVLEVIENEKLDLKVMLGAYITAEENNHNCPWGGGVYTDQTLQNNRLHNQNEINKLIELANTYASIIFSLSVGNEACVEWTDHMVPVARVIEYVKQLKAATKQPVTFCENYVPWLDKLAPLVEAVDFISIHTYPLWEYKTIDEAISFTKQNYEAVAKRYPHKLVVITEAGWASTSNGKVFQESMPILFFKKYTTNSLVVGVKRIVFLRLFLKLLMSLGRDLMIQMSLKNTGVCFMKIGALN